MVNDSRHLSTHEGLCGVRHFLYIICSWHLLCDQIGSIVFKIRCRNWGCKSVNQQFLTTSYMVGTVLNTENDGSGQDTESPPFVNLDLVGGSNKHASKWDHFRQLKMLKRYHGGCLRWGEIVAPKYPLKRQYWVENTVIIGWWVRRHTWGDLVEELGPTKYI